MAKRAVSISLESTTRDRKVTLRLLGEELAIERIGTNGDVDSAIQLYHELDGQVDAFRVGGIDLGLAVGRRYYPPYSAQKLVAGVRRTPVVDGGGLSFDEMGYAIIFGDLGLALGIASLSALCTGCTFSPELSLPSLGDCQLSSYNLPRRNRK